MERRCRNTLIIIIIITIIVIIIIWITTQSMGVKVEQCPTSELQSTVDQLVSQQGCRYCHSFDDIRLIAGYGSYVLSISFKALHTIVVSPHPWNVTVRKRDVLRIKSMHTGNMQGNTFLACAVPFHLWKITRACKICMVSVTSVPLQLTYCTYVPRSLWSIGHQRPPNITLCSGLLLSFRTSWSPAVSALLQCLASNCCEAGLSSSSPAGSRSGLGVRCWMLAS